MITTVIGPDVRWSMSGTVPTWRSRARLEQVPEQQELGDGQGFAAFPRGIFAQFVRQGLVTAGRGGGERQLLPDRLLQDPARSEERRVGKECRSRWSPY